MVDPWKVLGIAPTSDVRTIKKAYAARLKRAHPEDDAAAFQELRQAYELALGFARWQQANAQAPPGPEAGIAPAEPAPSPAPYLAPPALASVASSLVDPRWTPDAATALLARAEQLFDDPEQRASASAWQALLADESLWHVDTRTAFERGLIAFLIGRGSVFPPVVGCLLEQEFRWTEQAMALQRRFPAPDVDVLIGRLEQAPLDLADELWQDGRYQEARVLLEQLASSSGPSPRFAAARRLSARCVQGEKSDRLMREVEGLRGDARGWTSLEDWRRLLDHEDLRNAEVREAFQLRLARFLGEQGQGLTGPVWRLLYSRYSWPGRLPERVLARALPGIAGALVEDAERLVEEGKHQQVVTVWARLILRLDGDAAARGRALLETCYARTIERAEALAHGDNDVAVIDLLSPVTEVATADAGARARELLERIVGPILTRAQEHFERQRFGEAIAQLAPVVRKLRGDLGVRARLLLARCYHAQDAHGRAEHHLEELLQVEPRNVEALLLLGAACRARDMNQRAWQTYRRVLELRPDHEEAAAELALVEQELQKERANLERRLAEPRPVEAPASSGSGSGFQWWWFPVTMSVLSQTRNCSASEVSIDPSAVIALVVALALIGGLIVAIRHWSSRPADGMRADSPWKLIGALVAATLVIVGLLYVSFYDPSSRLPPGVPETRPAGTGPPRAGAEVRIARLDTSGPLPVRPGERVVLAATIDYFCPSGQGEMKLLVRSHPARSPTEVASQTVPCRDAMILLRGSYLVPASATRLDVEVQLLSEAPRKVSQAAAWLAVGAH